MAAPHLLVLNAAEGLLQLVLVRLAPDGQGDAAAVTAPMRQEGAGNTPVWAGASGNAQDRCVPPDATARLSGVIAVAQSWHAPSQGAELLAPALEDALTRLTLVPSDIRHIACVRGPGSFTGLRLVLATAAGLARATGAQLAGLDYLPLLAEEAALVRLPPSVSQCGAGLACTGAGGPSTAGALEARRAEGSRNAYPGKARDGSAGCGPRLYWVLTHARRNLIHMQGFEEIAPACPPGTPAAGAEERRASAACSRLAFPAPRACTDLLVLPLEEAARCMAAAQRPPVLLGSGLTRNLALWKPLLPLLGEQARLVPEVCDSPGAFTLARAALRAAYSTNDISPLYARPCDAEENLEHIARSLGLDPAEARQRLAQLTHC